MDEQLRSGNGLILDGVKFRRARIAAGFETQEALANAVGIWPNSVGRMERGEFKPGKKLADKINSVLGIDIATLLVPRSVACAPPSDTLSAAIQQLEPEDRHFIAGLVFALNKGVKRDRALPMATAYAEIAAYRQVAEKDALKILSRGRSKGRSAESQ